jgi:MFS superfamily sulfate permease-like transporter
MCVKATDENADQSPPSLSTTTHQNQDLFALGVGNMVSACFSTFVAAGSFGRTALAQVGLD